MSAKLPERRSRKRTVNLDLFGHPIEERPTTAEIAVIPLEFEEHTVRAILIKGEPWWVGSEACRAMGIANPSLAINGQTRTNKGGKTYISGGLPADEKGIHSVNTPSGMQEMLIVNEPGLYRLAFSSGKPEAERFKHWVFHEVLPTIRKTGTYNLGGKDRIGRMAKKLRSDRDTAKIRCEVVDTNKSNNARLAKDGANPRVFAAYHNAAYRGLVGKEAKELRRALNQKKRATPLDRMGPVLLSEHRHAKVVADRLFRESPVPVPLEEQCRIVETVASEIATADMKRFGEGWGFGIVDDARRGTIMDMVKRQLPDDRPAELVSA